jgi:hypothetical protein
MKEIILCYHFKIFKLYIIRMIYILTPYRNREHHLKLFLDHYSKLLDMSKIKIIVIEQANKKPFNKGLLLNCGIKELNKIFHFTDEDFLILNDIDCLIKPHKLDLYLEPPNNTIHHIFGFNHIFFKQYNCLGGILSMRFSTFVKINGFPNNFWGWGGEDLALGWRSKYSKVPINNSKIISVENKIDINRLENPTEQNNNLYKRHSNIHNIKQLRLETYKPTLINSNGFNTCSYKVLLYNTDSIHSHLFIDF